MVIVANWGGKSSQRIIGDMQIKQLYKKYHIMPQLETHMLRVAGITKIITSEWKDKTVANKCVNLCLLHDMGNMAKFKLSEDLEKEWGERQREFWAKYGHDAHDATVMILEEMGLIEYRDLILEESDLFNNILEMDDFSGVSLPAILTLYADCRVAMEGVVSIEERIEDLERRYQRPRSDRIWAPKLEKYVQSLTKVDVVAISEADVESHFDELLTYTI